MSWIITKSIPEINVSVYVLNEGCFTGTRDEAKRFETKPDAKAFNDKYDLNGHIIPS